jgi:rod shape-determining protein MreD
MLVVTSSFGFMRGRKSGIAVGAISGLLVDIFWGQLLGFHTLLYTVIGYLNGSFERLFYDEDVKLPIVLISASEFLYGICIYVFVYMLQGDFAFGTYLFSIIIPELVYTILVTLILYQVILHINRKLESEEQRSASKFV